MLLNHDKVEVYAWCEPTDMRKGFEGLSLGLELGVAERAARAPPVGASNGQLELFAA